MKNLRSSSLLLGFALLIASSTASAQDNFKPLAGSVAYPGYLFYYMERPTPHRIEMRVTGEGVVRALGLELAFPKAAGKPGLIFREMGRKDGTDFSAFEGFSFWLKGDGSDAKGAVVLGYSAGPTATFPLADKTWHRVDLKWADFAPAADSKSVGVLAFTLTAESARPASYVIDRPGFVKSFAAEDAADQQAGLKVQTAAAPLPERPADFSAYVLNADRIPKTKAKLAAKQPLTIVAWGDSITMGSQLWSVGDKPAQAAAIYHALFAEKLKKKCGYDAITIVVSAKGGYQTHQALPNIQAEVLAHKPDLVIMAVCAGDTLYSNFDTFKANWTKIVEKLLAEGIEVVLWTPTPIEFGVKKGDPFADYVRTYAKEHNLALVDQRACLLARGEEALGELIPDDAHPNPRGHELLSEALFSLFKD